METFSHTGRFKGLARLIHADEEEATREPGAMPVAYGDVITATFRPADGSPPISRSVLVHKGSDGTLMSFTKRFKDPKIAVQTQFSITEAYFELAKNHRKLGHESLARREMAQAKKLLGEAIRDYPQTEVRAQAEYLLASLSLEYANLTVDEDIKNREYTAAISRFTDIVANFPDNAYAPKAQYKKALTLEKMDRIDQACEEYVKLSYRYPDNELVAETIARLGRYFLVKGRRAKKKAETLADPVEREKLLRQVVDIFRTSAEVFGRLAERFPDHKLAGRTTTLSGQSYIRAGDFEKATTVLNRVVSDEEQDKKVRAEAMYWCGHAYAELGKRGNAKGYIDAYRMFKKLTWDYPESKWAKFARGRLVDAKIGGAGEEE